MQLVFQHNPQAPVLDREQQIGLDGHLLCKLPTAVVKQAPPQWTREGNRAPSVVWRKGVPRRWRVVEGRQAAAACLQANPHREVIAAPAAVAAAAAEEDKEGRICIHTHRKKKSGC
jgi:hypothetical protein